MLGMAFRKWNAIPAGRRRRRRSRSISSPASFSAVCPGNSDCANSWRVWATPVVTSDKDGANSVFERELPDADIVISQPFWPAYLTAERIAKAKKLKLAITAGIGSDHVDLQAAIEHGVTVAEVTYSNSISVSEHVVMMILSLVRNYIPSYKWVIDGGLEHRRLRGPLLRSRSDGCWYGCRRANRLGGSEATEALRRQASLHRSASASGRCREGTEPHLPSRMSSRWCASATWSRSTPAASGDRAPVQRRAHRQDEARRLSGEYGARQDLRSRRCRPRVGERAAGRLCGRRLVPAAGARRITLGGRCLTTA